MKFGAKIPSEISFKKDLSNDVTFDLCSNSLDIAFKGGAMMIAEC